MRKHVGYAAFTALILLLCLIPSLGMLLPAQEDTAGGNQALSAAPSLRNAGGEWNTAYLAQLQDYAGDNFYLRQDMITAWSALNAQVLGSSITEDVVLGSDGWLYFGDTLPDYAGLNPMTEREIFAAARNLSLVSEYCEAQGTQFLFTIAPNKNSLYTEHMPSLPFSSGPHNAQRLAEELEREGVDYLDMFALFGGERETLYFPQDSHWNSKGAALAADALNQALGRNSAYFDGPFVPALDHKGDLYDMLYPAGGEMEPDMSYLPGLSFEYDAPIRSAENLTIMTHGSGEGSLLMFRDSFGNLLYPYMADSFDAALFSRSMPYRLDLIAQREADCVVAELVERNLRYLIQNVPLMPAPQREAPADLGQWVADIPVGLPASDELPGYILFSLTLPVPADPDSPVYLLSPDGCYEAFLLENNRIALYVPESFDSGSVLFTSGGQAVHAALGVF